MAEHFRRCAALALGIQLGALACADAPPPNQSATASDSAFANMDSARLLIADSLLADSIGADSAALASLPPRLQGDLDLGPLLTEAALQDTTLVYCQPLSKATDGEVRKRLRGRWPGALGLVLFVRATRASGAINRVELVRRVADGSQRGYIWDRDSDKAQAVEWAAGAVTPETYDLPEGTPTPRALRGLGRRLLVLPCRGVPPGQLP